MALVVARGSNGKRGGNRTPPISGMKSPFTLGFLKVFSHFVPRHYLHLLAFYSLWQRYIDCHYLHLLAFGSLGRGLELVLRDAERRIGCQFLHSR